VAPARRQANVMVRVASKPWTAQRALMLTPDEAYLDRRIAQEAGSLVSARWAVDIYPAVDPSLSYGGSLVDGVRLLASPHPVAVPSRSRRSLQRGRRGLRALMPALDRAIEARRYRRWKRAETIATSNLAHLLGLGRYDLVFAHDVPVFPLGAQLAAAWDAPLICDLHEIFPEQDEHFTTETARRYWRTVEREGISEADGVICVNTAVADYVVNRYAPTAPIVTIQNSAPYVDSAALVGRTIRDHYAIDDAQRVMLFAGSLRPYANLETVIAGFARANLEGWVLAILGDGPLREPLEKLIVRLGLERRVFLGQRAVESELLEVTSSADIGLLPYQAVGINHEIATPNKLFEYIQARLPLATSRLPMIEKIVSGSNIGGFVDYTSERSTADGLRDFIATTLPGIQPDALEAAARRWSWEREETALFEVVDAAMARRRP
jgi:glycosyltransferase involved in cell wall biosynthesis